MKATDVVEIRGPRNPSASSDSPSWPFTARSSSMPLRLVTACCGLSWPLAASRDHLWPPLASNSPPPLALQAHVATRHLSRPPQWFPAPFRNLHSHKMGMQKIFCTFLCTIFSSFAFLRIITNYLIQEIHHILPIHPIRPICHIHPIHPIQRACTCLRFTLIIRGPNPV
jgi:hypothetical protein